MLTIGELAAALSGVGRLVRLQVDGFDRFDATLSGFWKSFWVALFVLPIWVLLVADQMSATAPGSPWRMVACKLIGYVISWLAYPLLMVRISDFLGRWPRYLTYMVAYNWFQLVQMAAWLPLVLLAATGILPNGAVAILWVATHGVLLAYSWFIARRGLEVDGGTACALVAIDFLLSLLIDSMADSMV
jgi:hypothetical protein